MGDLASDSHWQIVFAVVAAAALSCAVGWLLDGGLARLRHAWHSRLTDAPGEPASLRAARPVDDTTREFGDEFVRALTLAVTTYVDLASDEEAIINAIVTQLGWSPTRARWFFAVNRDQVEQAARDLRRQQSDAKPPCPV